MTTNLTRNYCNRCNGDTPHAIEWQCWESFDEKFADDIVTFSEDYDLLQCQICRQVCLRVVTGNSENGKSQPLFYPPRSRHKQPIWFKDIPDEYRDLTKQIYPAINFGLYGLALMGIRSLLDTYVSRLSGSSKNNFSEKLKILNTQGAISAKQIEILEPLFEAGSAAAHRGYLPNESNTITALEILENLIQLDSLGIKAQKLKSDTPPRKP